MNQVISILQITVSLLLVSAILLQVKGQGLGSTFGSTSETFRTKRGMEKILHFATIILIVVFLVLSLISVLF